MITCRGALLLPILLLATAQVGSAQGEIANALITQTWLQGATPTYTQPLGGGAEKNCVCAPDPILPNPACILCWCYGNTTTPTGTITRPTNVKACGLTSGTPTRLKYITGATSECTCAPDPFIPYPSWQMCRCPGPNPLNIPTSDTYTAWPNAQGGRQNIQQWPRCAGKYALCSFANCTMHFVGAGASTILLAECGCVQPTRANGLPLLSFVDPAQILDSNLADQTRKQCPQWAQSAGCGGPDSTPICQAIARNTIYSGQYDLVSTFTNSPALGGFSKLCDQPGGMFAQCMTAACFEKKAFDGSPVTCYCPVIRSNKYMVGAPAGKTASCAPNGPFVLSGVAV